MSGNFPKWIKRKMVKGVRGFNLDAYLMALEGWRRGLTLTWYLNPETRTDLKIIGFHPLGKSFSLKSKDKIHYFYRSRGEKVSNEAVDVGTNKQLTRERLKQRNIPTPRGETFNLEKVSSKELIDYANDLGYPLVVKPTFGSLGKGVTTNINNPDELTKAINLIKEIGYEEIIIEEYFEGTDYRVYVVDNIVAGVTKRLPANIIGDGTRTITDLIKDKNKQRKKNPYLRTKLIKVDDDLLTNLSNNNFTLDTIPEMGQKIYLRKVANVSAGGDPIDFLDQLPVEIKQQAVKALRSIHGLKHGGIDILVNGNEFRVIEINTTAEISMHIFPLKGKSRNVPANILDYYFPKTKGLSEPNSLIYFDYPRIRRLLLNHLIDSYKVTDSPKNFYKTRYIISGKVQKVSYRKWIRNQAVRNGLHGYTRNLKNGNVVVVVGGDEKKVKLFEKVCQKGSPRSKVSSVRSLPWKGSIKVGFEIRKTR